MTRKAKLMREKRRRAAIKGMVRQAYAKGLREGESKAIEALAIAQAKRDEQAKLNAVLIDRMNNLWANERFNEPVRSPVDGQVYSTVKDLAAHVRNYGNVFSGAISDWSPRGESRVAKRLPTVIGPMVPGIPA